MPLISEDDQSFIRNKLAAQMVNPVKIELYTRKDGGVVAPGQECEYCDQTLQLMEEVAALSDKIDLEVHDYVAEAQSGKRSPVERIPALVIKSDHTNGVKYYGIPAGYEFSTLIEDIVDVSRRSTALSEQSKQALRQLSQNVHIQVFVTPT